MSRRRRRPLVLVLAGVLAVVAQVRRWSAWATAAAVTRLVAPGPIDVVHAIRRWRSRALANAIAARAIACSL